MLKRSRHWEFLTHFGSWRHLKNLGHCNLLRHSNRNLETFQKIQMFKLFWRFTTFETLWYFEIFKILEILKTFRQPEIFNGAAGRQPVSVKGAVVIPQLLYHLFPGGAEVEWILLLFILHITIVLSLLGSAAVPVLTNGTRNIGADAALATSNQKTVRGELLHPAASCSPQWCLKSLPRHY